MRTLTNDAASKAWDEAHAYRDEIARNEAERRKPQPVITQCLLIVFALSVYSVGLTTGILP